MNQKCFINNMSLNSNSFTFFHNLWHFKVLLAKVLKGRITMAVHWMGHLLAFFAGAICTASYGSPTTLTSPCGLSTVNMLLARIYQVTSPGLVFVRPSLLSL